MSPDEAESESGDACHGETEEEDREDEAVGTAEVELEDCHVECGGEDKEEEKNGGDGVIGERGWDSAWLGEGGEVGWSRGQRLGWCWTW